MRPAIAVYPGSGRSEMISLWSNRLSGKFSFRKRFLLFALIALLATVFLYRLIPFPEPLFPRNYSTVVTDTNGKILRVFLNENEQWFFPPADTLRIPQKLKTAVMQFEDRYFYRHPGINPVSILRAVYQNITRGRIVSGASTLTMQMARLSRNRPRTFSNKFIEMLMALKIELHYSKEEIFRLYLNHAPYGGNIIGYRAASLKYFGKQPEQLTWGEAATLAVLPNAPGLISPSINSEDLTRKRNRLLRELLDEKIINRETFRLAVLESVPSGVVVFPFYAAHLARRVKEMNQGKNGYIHTTIDLRYQAAIENLLAQQVKYLKGYGIRNGAALLVENSTGEVRAYAGSQNFFDSTSTGQVDGVQAPRSTGSILKPFLYALSMDDGLVLPQTVIKDVPSYFGSFSPANYDEKFNGLVTAHEALTRSLNVPAVRLLNAYGLYPFYLFLQNAGLHSLFRTPDDYGLPLILGGAEASLWDLARLYRSLAEYGAFTDLKIFEDQTPEPKGSKPAAPRAGMRRTAEIAQSHNKIPRLISPGACYLTLEILRELKRPGAEYYWEQYQNQWPLAWKTGTSYGQRDAWAIGVSPQWTIAVWVGNFDGEPNGHLSGAACAGPLLFDIFNYLPKDPRRSWFTAPGEDLQQVKICRETGFLAGPDCPQTETVDAPLGMKPLKICPYHKAVYVTSDEKYQVCSLCWEAGKYKKMVLPFYPPDVAQYLRERGHILADIPPHLPACPALEENQPLQIVYPAQNARLWIPRDLDGQLQKVTLRVAHRQQNRFIYWYLDNHYLGSSEKRHVKAIALSAGWHVLEVLDEDGNRDRKRFYVSLRKS